MNEPRESDPGEVWPKDEFGRRESLFWLVWVVGAVTVVVLLITLFYLPSSRPRRLVVAYCAQDQVFAEPIFREFEQEAHVRVRTVFDSEAVKTVGMANRLLAERVRPRCDVFWGNEEFRTRLLAAQNVFRQTNSWAAFGYRSRRIVINTNKMAISSAPGSLLELTNQTWSGKVALANPQFGTTATHFHALRQHWGTAKWESWCRALAENHPLLVDGNSVVVKMVGRGEAWLGLTDSDDIAAGKAEGLPIAELPISAETLLIPNTVAVVRRAPHPQAAQELFEYLQRPQVVKRLLTVNALEGGSIREVSAPTLTVDWPTLLKDLETTTASLNEMFLK